MAFAATASASPTETYLAVGDSLAFGYSQQIFNEHEKGGDPPHYFENGYADDYATLKGGAANLYNLGCPGETTDSLIGNRELGTAMAETLGTTDEAACAYRYVDNLNLHHNYGGAGHSQLEAALEYIAAAPKSKPVKTLSLNIGANDQLHAIHKCEAEVKHEFETEGKSKYGKTPEEAGKNCILASVGPLFKHILTNLAGILYVIRHGETFAPTFGRHGLNYTGKIIFQGGYDPFGAVFTPGVELLPGSNLLLQALNFNEATLVAEFGGCFANPQPTFNPATVGKPAAEPPALQAFTNMANFTTFEGKKNGPDIHPTPLGYQELANIMHATCG